jgi:C-terminal processing protease CtpA/Prc
LGAPPDNKNAVIFGWKPQRNKYSEYYYNNVWEYDASDTIYNNVKSKKLLMPIAILISNTTGSAAEDFLIGFDYLKRATLIGEKTNGSTGEPFSFELPNGGSCRICTHKTTYPDGRKFVGIGIKPDIEIIPDLSFYLSNEDKVLNEAIRFLNEKVNYSR